jgi:CDP-diacylglycerol--glycerol-3-phosphate 3-phosphatidyltransferase
MDLWQQNWSLWLIILFDIYVLALCAYFGIFLYPKRELSEETKKRPRSFISNAFFREYWYFLMGPLKRKFIAWDISPNALTIWGFIFSALAGLAFAVGVWAIAGWMVILAATCDVYDGQLARARNISLKSGAYLDSLLDRLGESCMFFGMAYYFRHDGWIFVLTFLAFTASQIVSYTRARAEGLGFPGARGFFQRAERLIVMCVGFSLTSFSGPLNFDPLPLVKPTIFALSLGSVKTAITRGFGTFWEIKRTEK